MEAAFPGLGTVINVVAVILGALAGLALGNRLSDHVRSVVTDALGLVTLLVAALSAYEVTSPALVEAVGTGVPVLVVLGSLLIGGIAGSLLRIEHRLASVAGVIQAYAARSRPSDQVGAPGAGARPEHDSARERFIEGWLTTSLLFCVGPLTILGSLNDGLGRGIDQLVLKSTLDLFAAMAFAASFGIGVLFSAVSVAVVQGSLTVVGVALGSVVPEAHIAALTSVGGLLLVGIGLRLLRVREIPVGDLLPALVVAPLLVSLVSWLT
ncbi:DUF554 domain-containing protein [Ornithinimicrobium sediminis]|uniref:DUF554 domain-containing protein n=1 Tax=Ornithinimicrobium sediminis TaxID=2904603 RepID=UPI001E473AC5|nr:DUF554 domain-containing protein [Ornithinimicrobium sediminis]